MGVRADESYLAVWLKWPFEQCEWSTPADSFSKMARQRSAGFTVKDLHRSAKGPAKLDTQADMQSFSKKAPEKREVVKRQLFEEENDGFEPLQAGDFDQQEDSFGEEQDDCFGAGKDLGSDAESASSEEEDDASDDQAEQEMPKPSTLIVAMDEEGEERVDIATVRDRIQSTVRTLENFGTLRKEQPASISHSRSHYLDRLLKDAAMYYGYSAFMVEKLSLLFSPAELVEFLEANETPRPVTIRANTLKTRRRELAQALINRGATVEPIGKWTAVGLQVFESPVPIGATPEYMAGHYILQSASSFLPVHALGARPKERILDMSAAPGGKTTHIAADMHNTGCLFANDPSRDRARALVANLHRMGVRNAVVCTHDGRQFPSVIGNFDRVLLDAPCSGTGVISKDPTVKTSKTAEDFKRLTHLQKELILAAIDSIEPNPRHAPRRRGDSSFDLEAGSGVLVYSTCSVTVEENEEIIDYALRRRPNVRLVETGIDFGREGFTAFRGKQLDPTMRLARRYYPHVHNVDGFFVAKLVKFAHHRPSTARDEKSNGDENGRVSAGKSRQSKKSKKGG